MDEIKKIVKSDTIIVEAGTFVENAIGVFTKDPAAILATVQQIRSLPFTIRDGIFWENFYAFLTHVYDFDENTGTLRDHNRKKLAELLAEQTPNEEAEYEGSPDKLRENAKRLIKLIDDASTVQKAVYYANLARAALNMKITRNLFFKLCNCVRYLTEEDLIFLIDDIQKTGTATIEDDRDTIDDFRAVGILMEVDGGFSYTQRAIDLVKFGLMYEKDVKILGEVQQRQMTGTVSDVDVAKMFKFNDEGKLTISGNTGKD
ncbi:hypothetical protein SAMN04487928_101231 [Butyrivibrio proteoclasticus]|uniref:Uncharacterized protein n=1 Tax=Butyrivibrio proteoclasticus TaxID=43305 RepID=A0A1I5PZP9_9FIRM|nr:hypothetical protein [Butyrivibrio proteoclasticus]SFP39538.1 hypothetical protein SAMN04487928_101231 [Butyrivibrio proteoclasticus]